MRLRLPARNWVLLPSPGRSAGDKEQGLNTGGPPAQSPGQPRQPHRRGSDPAGRRHCEQNVGDWNSAWGAGREALGPLKVDLQSIDPP